ncbi:MAG: tail fiber protein [Proteobacteria bacterium]|nr:tail fiber protein [Pseudomonadota bacterium]
MKKHIFTIGIVFSLLFIGYPQAALSQEAYIGEIRYFAFNFCPAGWMQANGQLLQVSQYSALYSLLGNYYGGEGYTTFGLPDLQGRFALGTGNGANLTPRLVGDKGGAETTTLSVVQLPAHNHALLAFPGPGNTNSVTNKSLARPQGNDADGTDPNIQSYSTKDPSAAMDPLSIGQTGTGQPISIMPPFTGLTVCICTTDGYYPPRE